ncbi:MAG: fibronectin type III domain-containing protein [Solirubrobacteraceae bacterium]
MPKITGSPVFRQDGLLIITFDEADTSDASSCCGEIPGPGATQPGETGPPPVVAVTARVATPPHASRTLPIHLGWSASIEGGTAISSFELQERDITGRHGPWRTLDKATTSTTTTFTGVIGQQYQFRVRAVNLAGQTSRWDVVSVGGALATSARYEAL